MTTESDQILRQTIDELRSRPYSELLKLLVAETRTATGESGDAYQLEAQALWDDRRKKNLRVMVSIDRGGWDAFVPRSEDFIVAPDGTFVGE